MPLPLSDVCRRLPTLTSVESDFYHRLITITATVSFSSRLPPFLPSLLSPLLQPILLIYERHSSTCAVCTFCIDFIFFFAPTNLQLTAPRHFSSIMTILPSFLARYLWFYLPASCYDLIDLLFEMTLYHSFPLISLHVIFCL